jgi:magnesium transporter
VSAKPRSRRRGPRIDSRKAGAAPGTPIYVGVERSEPLHVQVIDYDAAEVRVTEAFDTEALRPYRNEATVTWIDLVGVHHVEPIQALCRAFDVHPLWIEDIVNTNARPKTDELGDQVLVLARMLETRREAGQAGSQAASSEHIAIVMGPGFVLTFQERPGDAWEAVRQRIHVGNGRVRRMGADYLLYALLDAVVDHYFVALEEIEARVDAFEATALDPDQRLELRDIFELKSELAELRRILWPTQQAIAALLRSEGLMRPDVLPFVRDLHDHIVHVVDQLDSGRERIVGVYELHIAVAGHRLNDIMKILTVVSTIFIPMTFIAGVYGMNFDHMPELHWDWGYPMAWLLMLGSGIGGAVYMVTRKWV